MLILSACASPTATGANNALVCASFDHIAWSARDTDETIRQAKAHNAVLDSFGCVDTAP